MYILCTCSLLSSCTVWISCNGNGGHLKLHEFLRISTENSCFAFVLKGRVTGVYLIIIFLLYKIVLYHKMKLTSNNNKVNSHSFMLYINYF